jgi:hypothetical protein
MPRTDWSAETSWDEVKARARGRRRFNTLQRDRAEVRRLQVSKRLYELREKAWNAGHLEWMPRGVVAQLAEEFGCKRQTISQDVQTIEREELRRMQIALRLPALRLEAGVGRKGRLPKDVVWRLACEFHVTPWTIRQDIRVIDRTTPYPRPPAPTRQPWDLWARLRPRETHLPRRMSVRMSEETYQWYSAQDDPSDEIRRALEEHRGQTKGYHTLDDCAFRVAQACPGEVQGRLVGTAVRLALPLIDVLKSLLLVRLKGEEG